MALKYYLITAKYENCCIGSILENDDKIIRDLDSSIEGMLQNEVPKDWIEISYHEMRWLIKRSITLRVADHTYGSFNKIYELKKGEQCFYRTINGDILCKIIEKKNTKEGLVLFNVLLENAEEKEVSSLDIELNTEESTKFKKMEDIMGLLLNFKGDIQNVDINDRCVLSMVYHLQNKSYFKMLLNDYAPPLNINSANIQALLRSVVKDKSWDLLSLILMKCNIQEDNNIFLPILTIEALKEDNDQLLEIIFKFAPKLNKLNNGETFLTNLFKEQINEATIIKVIRKRLFKVNEPNTMSETPLTLACERLMEELIKVLIENGANAHYNNFRPTMLIYQQQAIDPTMAPKVTRIMGLLSNFMPDNISRDVAIIPADIQMATNAADPLDEIGQIIQQLVINKGNITILNEKSNSVLTLSYNLPNKRLFNIFVQNYGIKLDLIADNIGQNLLTNMVKNKDMNTLTAVLNECVFSDKYDIFLINMALLTLNMQMKQNYKMIVDKCVNRNILTDKGETFLTSCFKEKIISNLMIDVLLSDYFNINMANASGETPFMLACEQLKSDIVEILLNKGCDIGYMDYNAIDIVVTKGKMADNAEERKVEKNRILDLVCGKMPKVKEKLEFMDIGFVDMTKVSLVKGLYIYIQVGDPVIVHIFDSVGAKHDYYGELRCYGILNNEICVGVELDEDYPFGLDGFNNDSFNLKCAPGHGVVTTVENIELNLELLKPHFLINNILDPTSFMKCKENWESEILKILNIKKDEIVSVYSMNIDNKDKMKGILRWFGTINGISAGVVELFYDHINGTNGFFWKFQLINCEGNRAIALNAENIRRYDSYENKIIPSTKIKFAEIKINSSVIYYELINDMLTSLYGTVKWSGMNDCDEYFYGIELEEKFNNGTDGHFFGQKLFECRNGYGVLASIEYVAPDPRFHEKVSYYDGYKSEVCEVVQNCIPCVKNRGKNIGIQGNLSSYFFDLAIFAFFSKSDVLDYMISPMINYKEKNKITKRFREALSFNIVFPLRKFGLVSFHHTKKIRDIIKNYGGKFEETTEHGIDIDYVFQLLSKLCPNEQLLSLKPLEGRKIENMFIQLLLFTDTNNVSISCQQALEFSMAQRQIMFDKIPSCLIMQAPQDSKSSNGYGNVIPSKTIEISNLCSSYYKKCEICDSCAIFQCKKCVETSLQIENGLHCKKHKCKHIEVLTLSKDYQSKSQVVMQLKAIICKDKDNFLTFVKEDDFKNEWISFEGQNYQKTISGYNEPKVTFEPDISHFLNINEEDLKDYYLNPSFQKIVKMSYIFIYYNSALTCY